MLTPRLRPYAWFALLASPLLIAYAIMTIAMIASLSAAPNYGGDPARDVLLPEIIFVLGVVMLVASVIVLVRTRSNRGS